MLKERNFFEEYSFYPTNCLLLYSAPNVHKHEVTKAFQLCDRCSHNTPLYLVACGSSISKGLIFFHYFIFFFYCLLFSRSIAVCCGNPECHLDLQDSEFMVEHIDELDVLVEKQYRRLAIVYFSEEQLLGDLVSELFQTQAAKKCITYI